MDNYTVYRMYQDVIQNQKTIFRRLMNMPTTAQWEEGFAAVDAETTRIGDYIASIVAQLNRTDLTDEQEAEQLAKLTAASERLKGVGASVEKPVPTEPLP